MYCHNFLVINPIIVRVYISERKFDGESKYALSFNVDSEVNTLLSQNNFNLSKILANLDHPVYEMDQTLVFYFFFTICKFTLFLMQINIFSIKFEIESP